MHLEEDQYWSRCSLESFHWLLILHISACIALQLSVFAVKCQHCKRLENTSLSISTLYPNCPGASWLPENKYYSCSPELLLCELCWIVLSNISFHANRDTHVLVHLLKSYRAYNVKSFSTVFSDNIQWNFKISFSCVRLNNQLGYNLITENWDHQKWDFCQNRAS